jgi:propionyl-CoA carboxylase alpha chain
MNTRLQVEHPVTELVTGLDLVEQMIRVAAGEKLSIRQKDVKPEGWAIEARVYAEDPERGFLPSTGRLVRYREPSAAGAVRIDSGVYEGAEISMFYDPMIAKVIGTGADRREAMAALSDALDALYIRGVAHNTRFLAALLRHPRFMAGNLSTGFIGEEFPEGFRSDAADPKTLGLLTAVAAVVHHLHEERDAGISGRLQAAEARAGSEWVVLRNGSARRVTVALTAGGFAVIDGDSSHELVGGWRIGEPLYQGEVNGRAVSVQVERRGVGYRLTHGSTQIDLLVLPPHAADLAALMPVKKAPDLSKYLLSPMPGLLASLAVKAGQEVKVGQELCVVEAMKMENLLRAERDGRVSVIHAKPGDSLAVDQAILEFE